MSVQPRTHVTAISSDVNSGLYRFTLPLRALIEQRKATGNVFLGFAHQLVLTPDSPILMQRQITLLPEIIQVLKANRCRLVHDFDDHLWAIPNDNPNANAFGPDVLADVDRQLQAADLITVSTEPLAAVLRERGYESVVVPNTLDSRDWTIQPRRAERSRLRIGWFGQPSVHAGDLAVIEPVVRALVTEVDFVFLGDVPVALADIADRCERYLAVPISLFPGMLAALDLDIVLAPLAHNAFNECKSNLRLLQAGVLGYAVIASDIEPHRTLPVTRVANTPAAWIAAIRERSRDLPAVRREAETLRSAVHAGFSTGDWAERILELWSGKSAVPVHA